MKKFQINKVFERVLILTNYYIVNVHIREKNILFKRYSTRIYTKKIHYRSQKKDKMDSKIITDKTLFIKIRNNNN